MKKVWILFVPGALALALAVFVVFGPAGGAGKVGASAPAVAPGWTLDEIDTCDAQILARKPMLDAAGHPHVVYACGRVLHHAAWDGGAWVIRTANLNLDMLGQALDFALGTDGIPRIVYITVQPGKTTGTLNYVTVSEDTWSFDTIDPGFAASGENGCELSLALDAANVPHVSYGSDTAVKYATRDGSTWRISTLDDAVGVEACVALDVTPGGTPHLVYHDASPTWAGMLRYALPAAGGGWDVTTVDTSAHSGITFGQPGALRLDAAGAPHVLYDDDIGRALHYAVLREGVWQKSTISTAAALDRTHRGALALDAGGAPRVAYAYQGGANLWYARQTSGGWSTQPLDTPGFAPAIAVDGDTVHIAHLPALPGIPTLATYDFVFVPTDWVYLPFVVAGN